MRDDLYHVCMRYHACIRSLDLLASGVLQCEVQDCAHMLTSYTTSATLDRRAVADWYRRNRQRSRSLFDLLVDDAYYSQPIALRHPIVFYDGHLPAFSFNTLVKKALGGSSIDPFLETLFARGIDPSDVGDGSARPAAWPE